MQLRSKQLTLSAVAHRESRKSKALRLGALLVAGTVLTMTGCGSGGIPPAYNPGDSGSGSGGSPGPVSSNNWELTMTAATPPAGGSNGLADALQKLSGSIETQDSDVRAVFRATSASCYSNALVIPLLGSGDSKNFTARSFNVKNQYLNLTGTYSSVAGRAGVSSVEGSYNIDGGCSSGEKGRFTGVRFDALTGTYTGSLSTGASATTPLTLTVMQSTSPTGEGSFILTGTVSAPGFSCFPSGTLAAGSGNGYVSGSSVGMTFTAPTSSGGTLSLNGTLSTDVKTLTVSPVISGSTACNGSLGSLTLTRQ